MTKTLRDSILDSAKDKKPKEERPSYTAGFDGLVDLVLNDGEVKFLTFDKEVLSQVTIDNLIYKPPQRHQMPEELLIPRADKVLEYAQKHEVSGVSGVSGVCTRCTLLFDKLLNYHKNVSQLAEDYLYILLVVWDYHTYCLEKASFSPIMYFYADAESGKSRTIKGMAYVAYRGVRKGDIRDAQLLRDCTHLKATLAFDMMDFWEKVRDAGSVDVVLNRYERGLTVSRVNRPDKGAFQDTDYYKVFGATIIATNEIIHDIAATRAIPFVMPKADKDFENEINPGDGLDLKEELTAWRLAHLNDEWPHVTKPVKGRLGDITRPLYQVLLKVNPKLKEEFIEVIKKIEKTKMAEQANSVNAEVLIAMSRLGEDKANIVNGVIASQIIASEYNTDKSEKEKLSSRKIGNRLKPLRFESTLTNTNTLGFFWNEELLNKLLLKYGVYPSKTPETPESPETPENLDITEADLADLRSKV